MVVKAKKHGSVRYRVLNAIMAIFPLMFPFFSLSFPILVLIIFHEMTRSVTLSGRSFPLSLAILGRGRVLPMTEEGFFLGLGPWPNVYIGIGPLVCYPPQNPYIVLRNENYEFVMNMLNNH